MTGIFVTCDIAAITTRLCTYYQHKCRRY